ncbi:MAG: alpha/beta hydrolase [Pseudomonadota bacterium]
MSYNNNEKPHVLFVPGAMVDESIWEDNFRAFFEDLGHKTHVMRFSGTGARSDIRNKTTFDDYVAECKSCIESYPQPPIVIAHSMGGLIALHAAAQSEIHSLIALSPAPTHGMGKSLSSLTVDYMFSSGFMPLDMFELMLLHPSNSKRIYKETMFSKTCDNEKVAQIQASLRTEAQGVLSALMNPPAFEKRALDPEKMLFIGATGDKIVQADEVKKTAIDLGSQYKIYNGYSHMFQAESDWTTIAGDIKEWLYSREDAKPKTFVSPFQMLLSAWEK